MNNAAAACLITGMQYTYDWQTETADLLAEITESLAAEGDPTVERAIGESW